MKKALVLAFAWAAVCFMPSCGKDPKPGEEPTTNQITFGNYEGMDVVTYDNIEWEYYEESVFSWIGNMRYWIVYRMQ